MEQNLPTQEYTGKEIETWSYWMDHRSGEKMLGNYYLDYVNGATIVPNYKELLSRLARCY